MSDKYKLSVKRDHNSIYLRLMLGTEMRKVENKLLKNSFYVRGV